MISLFQDAFNAQETAIAAIIGVFLGGYWIRSLLFALVGRLLPPEGSLPTVPKPAGHDFRETMKQGIMMYPTSAWIIPFQDPTVILPHSSLENYIKKIPEPDLTLNGNMYRRFFGRYTQVGTDDRELVDALKFDLTHNVHSLVGEMAEEVTHGFKTVVGSPAEWKSFPTYPTVLQIVALTSGRVFVGLPLSRDEVWLQASIQHTMGSVHLSDKLRGYYPWLRSVVAPFLKERKEVQEVQDRVAALLDPIITGRISKLRGESLKPSADGDEDRGRMTGWLLGHYSKSPGEPKPKRIVRDHLTLSFAAIHVASMALSHVLHDLADRPEYIGSLRVELDAEIKKCPGAVLTSKALANLVKMDSFIKESLRISPSGIVAWTRLATVPIHLQTGQVIPVNTMVAYCNPRFNPLLHSYENPDEFDGLRFVKLNQQNGPQARYKLDSLDTDSLGFGYGIHACPGRAFAAAELKLIVAQLIHSYDLRLSDGQSRPKNIYMDFQITPDPSAAVLLRARRDE